MGEELPSILLALLIRHRGRGKYLRLSHMNLSSLCQQLKTHHNNNVGYFLHLQSPDHQKSILEGLPSVKDIRSSSDAK